MPSTPAHECAEARLKRAEGRRRKKIPAAHGFHCFSKISCCQVFGLFLSLASIQCPSSQYRSAPHSPGSCRGAAIPVAATAVCAASTRVVSKGFFSCTLVLQSLVTKWVERIRRMQSLYNEVPRLTRD